MTNNTQLSGKQVLLCIFLLLFFANVNAQQSRVFDIVALSSGIYTTPSQTKERPRMYYKFESNYHFNNRHSFSINFLGGQYDHLHEKSTPLLTNPQNRMKDNVFYLQYKYNVVKHPKWRVMPGVGIGLNVAAYDYTYAVPTPLGHDFLADEEYLISIAFPISLNANYKISKVWSVGVEVGAFADPDYGFFGLHAGPKVIASLR
ncbi:MAG: hypothetical protein EOP53_04780 [Sphingobacteriales bacterium]|nr:MAG: hypothetical protein EOP53_04780 [Sphingobacteriales bacterium]